MKRLLMLVAAVTPVLIAVLFIDMFAPATASAQNGLQNPLNFGNNFLVTGDYVVAGAYGVNTTFQNINGTSYTVGTINVPDGNPGITGATQVPKGAQVVTALLYWQTVEMTGAKAGGSGSGQNGFFRPLLYKNSGGPPAPGYAISGTNVGSTNAVTWSFGTCSGTSSNKVTRTYRADVTGGLPVDANGNSLANGSFEVRLPSAGNPSTPLTFGATLVVIYRIPTGAGGPNTPLNAIVIYDGAADPGSTQLSVTQQLWGLQDTDKNPISRLTHIVAGGSSGRFQSVFLSSGTNALVPLPSLYPKGLPTFPGYYGDYGWDNPTWTFTSASKNPSNPVMEDTAYATTRIVPSSGCVSSGAVIVSTTVKNPDMDGILHSWKINQGYCDVALNPSCSGPGDPAWVPLPGAMPGQQDVFLQYDYMCSKVTGAGTCDVSTQRDSLSAASTASGGMTTYTGMFSPTIPANTLVGITGFTKSVNNGQFTVVSSTSTQLVVNNKSGVAETNPGIATYANPGDANYSFDPRLAVDTEDGKVNHDSAVDKVVVAYAKHGITLHAIPGNAIEEAGLNNPVSCADNDLTCTFPDEPGTIGFREGLAYIKNTNILTSTGVIGGCTVGTDVGCEPVFQHGKKDSYHYTLFAHGVGLPGWFLSDGSLASVKQSGNTVTFTTQSPHGISRILAQPGTGATASDNSCLLGRVTVVFAITNPNLEGTFCVLSNPAPSANAFSITVGGSPTNFTYTSKTDPNLSVANGQVTSMSGYSDVGGQNSVISLGYGGWGPPNNPFSEGNKWQIQAGTFMHELGHTMSLTHGGTFYSNLSKNPADYTPSFEVNCKPNVQTSMSYLFQFDLLQTNQLYPNNQPIKVVDYSDDPPPLSPQLVNTLTESSPQAPGFLNNLTYPNTSWFQLSSFNGATPATSHCDGSPIGQGEKSYSYINDAVSNFFWSANNPPGITGNDINFNGSTTDVMDPHNEWQGTPTQNGVGSSPGVDLLQISAAGTVSTTGVGGEAGGLKPQGGGGGLKPQGGGGGLKPQGGGGGLHPAGGGGGLKPQGGGGLKAEITHGQANSYARPPQGLFIVQEEVSPRLIDLTWFSPTIGAVVQYNISRSAAGGAFALLNVVPGFQTTYTDTVTCNPGGYRYQVTAVTLNDQGQQQVSSPSNTVPAFGQPPLTGCYTSPVNVVVTQPSAVQGTVVPITWALTDDFYITPADGWQNATPGNPVTNLAANTLVANGPKPGNCGTNGATTILLRGTVQKTYPNDTSSFSVTNSQTGQFTFNSDTDGLCAGTYTFTLTLDSGQQFTSSALQLAIDINDQDTPRITTLALPPSIVGLAYNDTLTEDGGTAPLTWTVSGLPTGISQQAPGSPTLSGMTCVAAGSNNVSATVTDAKSNSGTQAFTLQVNKANTTTSVTSNANPSVFQQMVTFTVTVSPQYGCTPTGTVTLSVDGSQVGSNTLTNGMATFTAPSLFNLTVGVHSITASYGGDSSFNSSNNNSSPWSQTVNKASTSLSLNSVLPSTVFVAQPITISYTFGVVAPGAGSPIAPTGSISVLASDGSSCTTPAVLPGGMCTLSPAPAAAGNVTFTITYSGDGNFVTSGANSNYTVYQLVFTTQPSNTGVGLTMPAVVVTAEDSSNAPLMSFTGGITLAIGSGPGALSGTTTQSATGGIATFSDLSINKVANGYTLTASPSGGLPSAMSNAFNIDTFYVDGNGNFGTLDLPTGTVTQIGAATVAGSNGIDLTPGLSVYAYNASNQLTQITTSTGAASQIGTGTTGSIPNQATTGALTNGSYFGIDAVTGILYSIDLSSGATTQVGTGPTSAAVLPAGCNLDSSLTGSASMLYYTIGYSGGASCSSPMFDTLYQIDPTNGATMAGVQVTGSSSGANSFVGSAYVGGTLYGFTAVGQEYTIDPGTGAATSVANTTPTTAIFGAGSSQ